MNELCNATMGVLCIALPHQATGSYSPSEWDHLCQKVDKLSEQIGQFNRLRKGCNVQENDDAGEIAVGGTVLPQMEQTR